MPFKDWLLDRLWDLFNHWRWRTITRARGWAADCVRSSPEVARAVVFETCAVLLALGLVVAGLVLAPLGILLLCHELIKESMNPTVVVGKILLAVAFVYIVVPLLILWCYFGSLFRRWQRRADDLAATIRGPPE